MLDRPYETAVAAARTCYSSKGLITADDVERGKPDPAIFLRAAEALGCAPASCMAIEDSPNGIDAAQKAGMFTVAVLNRYNQDLNLAGLGEQAA